MFGISGAALIIILVAVVVPSVGWWQSHLRLENCEAKKQSFEDQTRLAGKKSEDERKEAEIKLGKAAANIQERLNETAADRDKRFADYERLLAAAKGVGPRNGQEDSASASPAEFSCPNTGTEEFNKRMGEFEAAVSGTLLKTRDEAIDRNIACKQYLEQIGAILPTEVDHGRDIQR